MAHEIECNVEELKKGIHGEESWKTQYFQDFYTKQLEGVEVYAVKPWDIQIGDKLVLRDRKELELLEKHEAIPAHWFVELHDYIEMKVKEIVVDEEIYGAIYRNESVILSLLFDTAEELYWHISLPMLQKVGGNSDTKKEVKEEKPTYSIIKEKNSTIIEEMIKKVDKKRLKVLLSVSASLGEGMRHVVSNDVVDQYLKLWAEAKYEFYLLMGRQLTMSQDIEVEVTTDEIKLQKKELMTKFPKYAIYIDDMPWNYFKTNEMTGDYLPSCCSYGSKFYTGKGMKLSKFFSQFLQDNEFDIEFSKILQDKKISSTIHISIDPYDYLTSSINQHGWKSCHRISDGEWGTGSLSYMLDQTTLVAFRAKTDTIFDYNIWGYKFKGNSKQFRQLIYFDKASCSILFGRQYPNGNKEVAKHIRYFLEDTVATYLDVANEWKVYNESYDGQYKDAVRMHYSDIENGFSFKFARLSNSKEGVANWLVGSKLPCLCGCGNMVEERGERAVCSTCIENLGDADDYYPSDDDNSDEDWD